MHLSLTFMDKSPAKGQAQEIERTVIFTDYDVFREAWLRNRPSESPLSPSTDQDVSTQPKGISGAKEQAGAVS